MTNREKINQKILSMSDEELASHFVSGLDCDECPAKDFCNSSDCPVSYGCHGVVEAWFKKEAKDDEQREIQSEDAQPE